MRLLRIATLFALLACPAPALAQDAADDRGTTFVAGAASQDESMPEPARLGFLVACGAAFLGLGAALLFSSRLLGRAEVAMKAIDASLGEEGTPR